MFPQLFLLSPVPLWSGKNSTETKKAKVEFGGFGGFGVPQTGPILTNLKKVCSCLKRNTKNVLSVKSQLILGQT